MTRASIAVFLLLLSISRAEAADRLRVGKPEPRAFDFAVIEIGMAEGIFAKYGIECESIGFGGGAMVHQAMAARQLDIGLGSGPEMASIVKGSPEMTVAAMAGAPTNISIIVPAASPIHDVAQLKGKTIGAGSKNSLTGWAAAEMARREGWGPADITFAETGSRTSGQAQLQTGGIDASVDGTEDAYQLEAAGRARILVRMGDIIPDFLAHVIFASNDLIKTNPDLLRRFLKAWFETVAYMRSHEDETVRIAMTVSGLSQPVAERAWRDLMPPFSSDGRFDPKALAVVEKAMLDEGLLSQPVDMKTLYTEAYLPK